MKISVRRWGVVTFTLLSLALPLFRPAPGFGQAAERAESQTVPALAYALKGDQELAFEWLQRAITAGFNDQNRLNADPNLENLRADPRFKSLLERAQKSDFSGNWTLDQNRSEGVPPGSNQAMIVGQTGDLVE